MFPVECWLWMDRACGCAGPREVLADDPGAGPCAEPLGDDARSRSQFWTEVTKTFPLLSYRTPLAVAAWMRSSGSMRLSGGRWPVMTCRLYIAKVARDLCPPGSSRSLTSRLGTRGSAAIATG